MTKEQDHDEMDEFMKGMTMDIKERRSVTKTKDTEDIYGKYIAM